MSDFLKFLLSAHVVLGLLGVAAFSMVWLWLLKAELNLRNLRKASLGGTLSLLLSWLCGGYYYVVFYGVKVKPVIKAGHFAWAHTVVMEAKEHIFLFLPFLAIVLTVILFALGDSLAKDQRLKSAASLLAGTTALIGVIITLAGAVISGAVR